MIPPVDLWRPLRAVAPDVDNLPTSRTGNDRIAPPAHNAVAPTVRLRRRRRMLLESLSRGQQSQRGRVRNVVDNSALRELSSLAFVQ